MKNTLYSRTGSRALALAGAVSISLAVAMTAANAQTPPPDLPAGGPPPGGAPAGGPPPSGGPGGPPRGQAFKPGGAQETAVLPGLEVWKGPKLTEAQQIVADLPPAEAGSGSFAPAPGPNEPKPGADPRDLQGTWFHNQPLDLRADHDMYENWVPYTMAGAKKLANRVQLEGKGTPVANSSTFCRPPGPQWHRDLNMPWKIFQTKDFVEFFFEEYHGRWYIALTPEGEAQLPKNSYMGKSVGHWEGDTLVVESTDFKVDLWLDVNGTALSKDGKMITRIRKVDPGDQVPYLEMITTFIDPKLYTQSWSVVRTYGWGPNQAFMREYNCEEQVGDPAGGPDAGLINDTEG